MEINQIEAFYSKSLMFLKVAKAAASKTEEQYFNNSEFQNVIAYNLCTAYELFLKYAILIATPEKEHTTVKLSHNLSELYDTYKELYPEEKYILNIPIYPTVDKHIEGVDKEREDELRKMNFDQMLKYPIDKKLSKWELDLCLKFDSLFIEDSEKKFDEVFQLINRKLREEKGE